MILEDGRGQGKLAGVNNDNQLLVFGPVDMSYAYFAGKGQTFMYNSTYSATGGQHVIYLRNDDSTRYLRINRILVSSAVNQTWNVNKITAGTPAGTAITGVNLNFSSAKTPVTTSFGNAAVTGITGSSAIATFMSLAYIAEEVLVNGSIILPSTSGLSITASATGVVTALVSAYYDDSLT